VKDLSTSDVAFILMTRGLAPFQLACRRRRLRAFVNFQPSTFTFQLRRRRACNESAHARDHAFSLRRWTTLCGGQCWPCGRGRASESCPPLCDSNFGCRL